VDPDPEHWFQVARTFVNRPFLCWLCTKELNRRTSLLYQLTVQCPCAAQAFSMLSEWQTYTYTPLCPWSPMVTLHVLYYCTLLYPTYKMCSAPNILPFNHVRFFLVEDYPILIHLLNMSFIGPCVHVYLRPIFSSVSVFSTEH
jgi:hypothetical protein